MAREDHKSKEVVAKLRQVKVLIGQGKPATGGIRAIGNTEATYCSWQAEHNGLKGLPVGCWGSAFDAAQGARGG